MKQIRKKLLSVALGLMGLMGLQAQQNVPNGYYYLGNPFNTQRLIIDATNNAEMADAGNNDNQKWTITHLGGDNYTVKNIGTNRFLEVPNAQCGNLINVASWTQSNQDHHRWNITKNGNDFVFKPLHCKTTAMDRNNGAINANAHLYSFSATNNNQKWTVEAVSGSTPPAGGTTTCSSSATITGLTVSASTNNSVTISFDSISDVTNYEVRTFTAGTYNNTLSGAIKYNAGASSPIIVTGLDAGTNFTFAIRALCGAGAGATPLADVNGSTTGGTTQPTPPTSSACSTSSTISGMAASSSTDTSITISFDNLSGIDSYELRAFLAGEFNGNINLNGQGFKGGNSSPLTMNGLLPGQNYTFVLRAICSAGGLTQNSQINAATTGTVVPPTSELYEGQQQGNDRWSFAIQAENEANNTSFNNKLTPNRDSWKDSYEANGFCFCDSSFDHGFIPGQKNTNGQQVFWYRVNGVKRDYRDICDELTKHPSYRGRNNNDPVYNDIQCGNGPGNDQADEHYCPGRVDGTGSKAQKLEFCQNKGPQFPLAWLQGRSRFGGSAKNLNTKGDDSSFVVYPNPAKIGEDTFLNIDSKQSGKATISILDLSGKRIATIYNTESDGSVSAIEITGLINAANSKGIYILTYELGDVLKSEKIIIK